VGFGFYFVVEAGEFGGKGFTESIVVGGGRDKEQPYRRGLTGARDKEPQKVLIKAHKKHS